MSATFSSSIHPRWRTFATHLLAGRNATDAYLLAGYKSRQRPSAQAASSRLLRHPNFASYYEKLRRRADARSRRRTLRNIQNELRHLTRVIETSASIVLPSDRKLIESRKSLRRGGRVTRLLCKLTALQRHTKLTDHQFITLDPPGPGFSGKPQPFITLRPLSQPRALPHQQRCATAHFSPR